MKDKEKAKEILEKVSFNKYLGESYIPSDDSENCEFNCGFVKNMIVQSAIEMAQWKEQQVIEYLYKNIQSLLNDYGVSEASADIATQLFLANLKQAMEENP